MPDLYILETCPYCQKVMAFLGENNVEYNKFDISEKQNLEKLLELGGHEQVPFLYDKQNNIKMYESDDIIAYVKNLIK